jgi:hypothetical protein
MNWVPFFQELVWPTFWAVILVCTWKPLRRLLKAYEERIASGAAFEAGPKGLSFGASAPKLTEVPSSPAPAAAAPKEAILGARVPNAIWGCLLALIAAGCAAAEVLVAPDAARVQVGTAPPVGASEQIGAVTATHGGGCGLYGRRGSYEGADAILRTRAARLGADYVQILRVTEPHMEGICAHQAFVIDAMAYRLTRGSPSAVVGPSGLNGTYSGEISGDARGQRFTMRVTFTLVQNGTELVGTWSTTGGTAGTILGVVEHGRIAEFRVRQVHPCPGEFVAAVLVDGTVLRGQYGGSDCGGAVTASFEAVRQP